MAPWMMRVSSNNKAQSIQNWWLFMVEFSSSADFFPFFFFSFYNSSVCSIYPSPKMNAIKCTFEHEQNVSTLPLDQFNAFWVSLTCYSNDFIIHSFFFFHFAVITNWNERTNRKMYEISNFKKQQHWNNNMFVIHVLAVVGANQIKRIRKSKSKRDTVC